MRIPYMILLILGCTSGIFMETCPSEEDITPCMCQDDEPGGIEVQCVGPIDLKLLKGALYSLSGKNVAELYLENLKLGKLASTFFYGIHIKRLEFDRCDLDSLTNNDQPGLLGLENYLEKLVIQRSFNHQKSYNKYVQIKLTFGHLKKLKELDLIKNGISEIDNGWFSDGPSFLENLVIEDGNVLKIGSNAFSQLNNLKQLHLEDIKFGPITRSMLPSTPDRLERLEIEYTNLTSNMPNDIFSKMPSISKISLRKGHITTIDERIWAPIWQQLNKLDLLVNEIRCDSRLNWIIKLKRRPVVSGYCGAPKKFKGLELTQFFNSRSQ